MALVNALCTLAEVKTLAGIGDTSQDARLELIINSVSAQIASYCGCSFARATYTNETYSPSNRQLLILRSWPVVSVSSLTVDGTATTDYVLSPEYSSAGFLYRRQGWMGQAVYRTVLTDDPVAMDRTIQVTYVAGYYLPADAGYVAGAAESLPLELSYVCSQMALASYYTAVRGNFDGLTGLTEGGLSYQWGNQDTTAKNNQSGLLMAHAGILNKYRRVAVAA